MEELEAASVLFEQVDSDMSSLISTLLGLMTSPLMEKSQSNLIAMMAAANSLRQSSRALLIDIRDV